MKAVLRFTLVLTLLALVMASAGATENNWRFVLRADNNAGAYMSDSKVGIYSTSVDGYDNQDKIAAFLSDPCGNQFAAWLTTVVPGRTEAFYTDIKAPIPTTEPAPAKSWDMRVYALKDATYSHIRVHFLAVSTSTSLLPPATINGVPMQYYLRMVNNRSVAGAPSDGTEWIITIPTVASTNSPFFTLILPTGYGTAHDVIINPSHPDTAAAEGYAMEYGLRPVPEPGGVLALGMGITGLGALILRRKR